MRCVVVVTRKPAWIEGKATLTIVKSSTTMNCAIDKVSSNANPAPGAPGGALPSWSRNRPPPRLLVPASP
jgi:hypothetical protein